MAHMYPPMLIPGQDGEIPRGERILFERLKDAPGTDDWRVLHSYYFSEHVRQRSGEADFVVIIPGKGVVVVEVKSHGPLARIYREQNGVWHLGNTVSAKGPFRQASDNAETLRRDISVDPRFNGIVVTSAVWFTHRDTLGITGNGEWHAWQELDRSHYTRRPAATTLLNVIDAARNHLTKKNLARIGTTTEPSQSKAKALAEYLRPSFEMTVNRGVQKKAVEAELLRFTTEQFTALDMLASQPRAEIVGAAGTGKTFLALEMARRRAAAGDRVLLCCFNRGLGELLEASTNDEVLIQSGTLHKELLQVARISWQDDPDFASKKLPAIALDQLLESGLSEFDTIIIDEAQDLLTDEYLDCLDLMLKGGLAAGKLMLFGDYQRQTIYGRPMGTSLRSRVPDMPPPFHLTVNCRNTPELEAPRCSWSDLANGAYTYFRRPQGQQEPPRQFFVEPKNQGSKLAEIFRELRSLKNNYKPEDVVILSPVRNPLAINDLPVGDPWLKNLSPRRQPGKSWYTTIHGFKGLESPVVILIEIEDIISEAGKSLLYIGMTRATERLFILASPQAKEEIVRRI